MAEKKDSSYGATMAFTVTLNQDLFGTDFLFAGPKSNALALALA
jgi:hypothetical protein